MAPEQIRCQEVDARTDIWGMGAVLYEMTTGQRPFPVVSGLKLIEAIQHLDPPAPSTLNGQITSAFDAVILKALDKDPNRRYQSAGELAVDLSRLLPASLASGKLAITEYANARPWMRWTPWIVGAIVLTVCTFGGYRFREHWNDRHATKHTNLLAVLPFDSTGQDDKTKALIVGMTETLTARLAQTWGQGLERVSARDITEKGVKTTEQAWKEFGSDLVLEGSAHQVGDQIRINCSLVDPKTHRQLTARTITANTKDVFGLEDQVVDEIVSLLATNRGRAAQASPKARTENNAEAYASYLRGRGYLQEYQNPENIDLAIAELRNAVTLDPGYPNSYAVMGEAYLLGYQQTNRSGDWVNQAQE